MTSRVRAYTVAVGAVAAATACAYALRPLLEGAVTPFFFAAVVLACWYGGLRPGLLATALSLALTEGMFFPPLLGVDLSSVVRAVTFTLVALLTASLYSRAREAQARAEALAEAREELLRQEQAARADAETAGRAKDEFLATLSHELRTPLNALVGWSWWIRRGDLPAERRERALEIIERSAQSVAQLVEDLLDVSRIITGKLRLSVRAVAPAPSVLAALNAIRPAAAAKSQELLVDVDESAGMVMADPDRLQQIAWNLLSNAVKFTPDKGRVEIALRQESHGIMLAVKDSGKGMAPASLPHVFDRFRQIGQGRTSGLGLGLSIVRHLVEVHGGHIRAESPGEGLGATFTVTLPLAGDAMAAAPQPAPAVEGPRLDGLRVLVVEDDVDSRRWLEEILGHLGAMVIPATSAREALALFIAEQPDVLVSDIRLTDADGYELVRRVRAHEGNGPRQTPAIALTAYPRVEDRARALEAGFQMHVPKPVAPADLASVIASVTGRGSGA